jgi:hypothetical protein
MADFWQQGPITVPQRLRNRPIAELEGEIEAVARRRRIVLMLPAFYAEFETDAMPRILGELKKVRYLHQKASVNRICQVEIAEARCVAPLRSSVPTRPAYRCCRLGCGSPPL